MKLSMKLIKDVVREKSPWICTALGLAGMAVTAYMVYKEAPKAKAAVEEVEEELGEDCTVVDKVKAAAPHLVIPACLFVASSGLLIQAPVELSNRLKGMDTLYMINRGRLERERRAVREEIGEKKAEKVLSRAGREELERTPIPDEKIPTDVTWCCEDFSGKYYISTWENIKQSFENVKGAIRNIDGYASLEDFHQEVKGNASRLDITPSDDIVGWNEYDYDRMDISHYYAEDAYGRVCCFYSFTCDPYPNYIHFAR